MTELFGVLLALPGLAAAGCGLYLLVLATASAFNDKRQVDAGEPTHRLIVLVPAHNEELLVHRCVASLLAQSYPSEMYRVVVVADNCSDSTASIAAAAGAHVMTRTEPQARGKGQALRWAVDLLISSGSRFDAVAVVDADSVADRDLLVALEAELRRGHRVVQADYTVLTDEASTARTRLVSVAFLLFHRVRFSGRSRLGLPANLVGNGMLFSREVLLEHPWSAFSGVEDLEYSIDLRMARVAVRYARYALIAGPGPTSKAGELRQRVRWEGGRFHVMRNRIAPLLMAAVSRRDPGLVDAAVDLATPPLALLAMFDLAGLSLTAGAVAFHLASRWVMAPWVVAMGCIPAFVIVGLIAAGAPRSAWAAILRSPAFLAWKLVAYLSLARGFDPWRWERTDRGERGASIVNATAAGRIELAGVPIDAVDMDGALERMRSAIGGGRLFQVSTVNLDFLVRAQTNPEVMRVFRKTDLNLADGAPVVWLSRLLGASVPERVAGADLVPNLLRELAGSGTRIFMLGGEGGVAAAAAARLSKLHPDLVVAGTYEPPRAPLEGMDHREILERITEAKADVLLVALGHPKQELWIDMHRDVLPLSVAIGVGCVFDLIAGRTKRAPRWMQAIGFEWLYRVAHEPRRLLGRYLTDAAWLIAIAARATISRIGDRRAAEPV